MVFLLLSYYSIFLRPPQASPSPLCRCCWWPTAVSSWWRSERGTRPCSRNKRLPRWRRKRKQNKMDVKRKTLFSFSVRDYLQQALINPPPLARSTPNDTTTARQPTTFTILKCFKSIFCFCLSEEEKPEKISNCLYPEVHLLKIIITTLSGTSPADCCAFVFLSQQKDCHPHLPAIYIL